MAMERFGGQLCALLLLNLILLGSPLPQTETTFKVGAWGDDASRGNLGVQAQIETHIYDSFPGTLNYFWVGDDLADGSFIQFGYSLEPGTYCLNGASIGGKFTCSGSTELIQSDDARWQWQYWPNRFKPDYYYGIGPSGSAGTNGTRHLYTIAPNPSNSWSFMFDGKIVSNSSFPVSQSTDPAFVVAEGSANANESTMLGPVKFRQLSYFNGVRWNSVDSLVALSYCGTSVACFANSYGATAIGPNLLLAGSNVPRSADGSLLWTSRYVTLNIAVHPNALFFVTSILGTSQDTGNAEISIPQGMFAYVSLSDTVTNTPGIVGLIGGRDQFQGWSGAVNSRNLTVQVLMDSNKTINADWGTDASIPLIVVTVASIIILTLVIGATRRRLRDAKLNAWRPT
jgi:hypothetical protein